MMFATSCENELDLGTNAGENALVTFSVGTPEIATRAFSDGLTATVLQYAVYDAEGNELTELTKTDAEIHGSTAVNLQLTTGNTYSVIFWAAAENAPYTVDFGDKTMTVDYTKAVSNDENRDAFYKYHTFTVKGAQTETIELKRPFAQLNVGTSDYAASTSAGYTPAYSYVKVPVYNTLDLVEGKVSTVNGTATSEDAVATEFKLAAIPEDETFPVDGYDYLSMNYLLVAADKEVVDVEFGYSENNTTVEKTRTVGSVPVQRNYRTNIYGSLFTSEVDINVTIDPEYDKPAYDNEHLYTIDENGAYHLHSAEGMAYFAQQVNAGNATWAKAVVILDGDIDLSTLATQARSSVAYEWEPIGIPGKFFQGTFDGCGHKISNFQVTTKEGYAGLFGYAHARFSNLTVENVEIVANHYAGGIVGQGYCRFDNCHVKNVKITLTTKNNDWGDKAGGIIGQNCEGTMHIKNCSAEDVTIKGYRDLGGIAGMAQYDNIVTDCSVKNITIEQDLSVNYQTTTPTTLAGVVGRLGSNVTYENNTEENVYIATASTPETFADLLKRGGNIVLQSGEYTFPAGNVYAGEVNVVAAEGANVVVNLPKSTYIEGTKITFKDLTFKVPAGLNYDEHNFAFVHHAAQFNMNKCVIEGGRLRLNVSEANIDWCQFNVTESSGFDGYGLFYYGKNGSTVNVSNSTFTALQKAIVLYNEGAVAMNLNVDKCTFTASETTSKAAISIHSEYGINGTVNINESKATGFADYNSGLWRDVNNNTGNDNKNFTVTVDGKIAAVKGYGAVTEGYYAVGNTYTVLTGEGFYNVATTVLSDASKNVIVELANDIDLAGIEWPAVKTDAAFVLDGKGFSIKNLTTSAVEDHGFYSTAMFTSTRQATTIKNVVVENATVTGNGKDNSHGAVLVACNYSDLTFSGVTVKNSTVSNCDRSAVITTYLYFTDVKAEKCDVEGCTVNSIGTAGAILGMNNSHNFEMVNCTVKGTTISSSEGSNKAGILIGTWQKAGTLTEEGNVVENSKAINADVETNNNIGRTV